MGTNKAYKVSCLIVENLSMAISITHYGSISTTKPGLITKKRKLSRISLNISHFNQPLSLLLNLILKNMYSNVYILGNSKCATKCKWLFSSITYQI